MSGGRCRASAPEMTSLRQSAWLMSQGVATNHGDEEKVVPHKRGVGSGWLCTFVLDSLLMESLIMAIVRKMQSKIMSRRKFWWAGEGERAKGWGLGRSRQIGIPDVNPHRGSHPLPDSCACWPLRCRAMHLRNNRRSVRSVRLVESSWIIWIPQEYIIK